MLNIWIGRAGSGKSKHILDQINIEREKRKQILIVPENCSHEAEIDICKVCGPTACQNTRVLTFKSLAIEVLSEIGGLSDFTLDACGKLLTIRRCIQELETKLTVFGNPSHKANFLKELSDITDEFYAYDISPNVLEQAVQSLEGLSGDKLRDISEIYKIYDEKMHRDGFDCRSLTQKLADGIENSCVFSNCDVYFDGFTYFNKQEERIISNALIRSKSVTIALLGEKNNTQEFLNASRQRERLVSLSSELGIPCEIVNFDRKSSDALGHLEKNLFGNDIPFNQNSDNIILYEANNAVSEIEYISSEIRRLTIKRGYRYRDIGISCRNLEDYSPLIHAIFARDGIPFFESRKSSVLDNRFATFLLSAISAVSEGFEYKDIFRYLKTGLTNVSDRDIDILENYCIIWNIRGKQWLKEKDWTMHPNGYSNFSSEDVELLSNINIIRKNVYGPLKTLYDGIKGKNSIRKKATAIFQFALDNGVPQQLRRLTDFLRNNGEEQSAAEYDQLWTLFCNILDQFVEILGDLEVNAAEFYKLLSMTFAQYTIGTIPATVDQVKLSEITRNDRHNVKIMFLIGANDGVLPSISKENSILNEEDRRSLQRRNLQLSDSLIDALDSELQCIYACIAQPTISLHISWPSIDNAGNNLKPSFVVKRIQKLFPGKQIKKESNQFRLTLPATAFEYYSFNNQLKDFFIKQGKYEKLISKIECIQKNSVNPLSQEAISMLYGNDIEMSASRLETLTKCKFCYFMQYGLNVKERKEVTFDAASYGTFVHYILENVTKEVKALGGFSLATEQQISDITNLFVDMYIREMIDNFDEQNERFKYLFYRLKNYAMTIVRDLTNELKNSEFVPIDFELNMGEGSNQISPLKFIENGTSMVVNGKIDRVDGWMHDGKLYIRVVDYKTGGKDFDLTNIKYGLGLQLLIYLFALKENGEDRYHAPIVPAGALYMPAQDELLSVERNMTDEEIERERSKRLKRKGIVLDNPEIIDAMEKNAMENAQYLPISLKKDGTFSSGVVSSDQFELLAYHVDITLKSICSEFGKGNVEARPLFRSSSDNACQFCKYSSACYFSKDENSVRLIKTSKESEFWNEIKSEAASDGN